MNRRSFITTATSAAAIAALPITKTFAQAAPGYQLLVLATNWGFSGTTEEFCAKAKSAGYNGVEVWWPGDEKDRARLLEACAKNGLSYGFLYGAGSPDFAKHEADFQKTISAIAEAKPLYINCHSGKDYFSIEQNLKLIEFSYQVADKSGVRVYHETHRGRALFSTPVTRQFMEKNSRLRVTLDISHWCNVHESLLGDQEDVVNKTLQRTDHIHARVGHAEGPQVSDPRAPEWKTAVDTHLGWWDRVVERKKSEGGRMTFLTEFGPPDYLPTLPYTRQPLANQWDINVHMLQVLKNRYA